MKHVMFIHTDTEPQSSVMNPTHIGNERADSADMAASTTVGQTSSVKTQVMSGINAVGGDAIGSKGSDV